MLINTFACIDQIQLRLTSQIALVDIYIGESSLIWPKSNTSEFTFYSDNQAGE